MKLDIELMNEIQKEKDVVCPHCSFLQEYNKVSYPVTYWGDEGQKELECQNCSKKFYVEECVRRWYRVTEQIDPMMLVLYNDFLVHIDCPSCYRDNHSNEKRCKYCGYPIEEYYEKINEKYLKEIKGGKNDIDKKNIKESKDNV
jgi:DNA-directed RNA polymerase subunit RPC12/RpoP